MNTKNLKSIILVLAIIAMLAAGCGPKGEQLPEGTVVGSGKVTSSVVDVTGVTSVVFTTPGYLTVTQGDAASLTIQAEDNILPLITTEVVDGVLTIGIKDNTPMKTNSLIQYSLTVTDLASIENEGAGMVTVNGVVFKDFSFKTSNNGKAKFVGIEAANLNIETSGGGEIIVSGTAENLTLVNSGAATFDGSALEAKNATLTLSGTADSTVNATGKLDVTLSGSGNLSYVGTPTLTQNVTGTGTISQAQ